MHYSSILLLALALTRSALGAPAPAICPDFTSWPPPVRTLPDPFHITITSVSSPDTSFLLTLPPHPTLPGYSTVLSNTSPGSSAPKIYLKDGKVLYSNTILGRNYIEDKSTLPKAVLFLEEGNVADKGFTYEATYVCGSDGVQRRILKKVDTGAGIENVYAVPFEEKGVLKAVIAEDQVLKPEIWLEIV